MFVSGSHNVLYLANKGSTVCMLTTSHSMQVSHPSVEELTDIAANCFLVGTLMTRG